MSTQMLTSEGKKMYKTLIRNKSFIPPIPPIIVPKTPLSELQVDFYRTEITELLENSKKVVIDCDNILSLCTTEDEYLRNDAKVAKMIHSRLIIRYTRLLNYQSALD